MLGPLIRSMKSGQCTNLYRATPCVSAVLAVGRCQSVCPSVTLECIVSTWLQISSDFFLGQVASSS